MINNYALLELHSQLVDCLYTLGDCSLPEHKYDSIRTHITKAILEVKLMKDKERGQTTLCP